MGVKPRRATPDPGAGVTTGRNMTTATDCGSTPTDPATPTGPTAPRSHPATTPRAPTAPPATAATHTDPDPAASPCRRGSTVGRMIGCARGLLDRRPPGLPERSVAPVPRWTVSV